MEKNKKGAGRMREKRKFDGARRSNFKEQGDPKNRWEHKGK